MKWSDIPFRPSTKVLRQFAAAWLVFFLAIGAQQYAARHHPRLGLALAALAIVVGGLGLIRPQRVRWIFVGWMVAAFPIGWVVSQTMLGLMFYVVLTPVALFLRLRGRDALDRKPSPDRQSYWTPKETPQDVRSYFRQY